MTNSIFRFILAAALALPLPCEGLGVGRAFAQSFVFEAPVDYDYDNMKDIRIENNAYTIGKVRKKQFKTDKHAMPRPLDGGGEFSFGATLIDDGDRAITTPSDTSLHQRESFLYTYGENVLLGQNIIREEAQQRLDTTYMMSFRVRKQMAQQGLPHLYDGPFELELDIAPDSLATQSSLCMVNSAGDSLRVTLDNQTQSLSIARGNTLASMPIAEAADPDMDGTWHLNIIVARGYAEIFVNEGRKVMTRSISLSAPLSTLLLQSEGGKTKFSAISVYRKPRTPLRIG